MLEYSSSTSEDRVTVVQLSGVLDRASSRYFVEYLEELIGSGHRLIIIDCADLGMISSFGFGALIRLRSRVNKDTGQILLCQIQNSVAEAMGLMNIDRLFKIYPTVKAARRYLATRESKQVSPIVPN